MRRLPPSPTYLRRSNTISTTTKKITPTPAEASHLALADAIKAEAEAGRLLADAQKQDDNLNARNSAGDRAVTGAALLASAFDIKAASGWLGAATRARRLAERNLIAGDLTLGACLVPVLADVLPGVHVEVVNERPNFSDVAAPSLLVIQRKPAVEDLAGYVAGALEVLYVRTPLHVGLNADAFVKRAEDHWVFVANEGHTSTSAEGALTVDSLALDIRSAWPPFPAISPRTVEGFRVTQFGDALAKGAERSFDTITQVRTVGVHVGGSGNSNQRKREVRATPAAEPLVISDKSDADGLRYVVVEASVQVVPGSTAYEGGDVQTRLTRHFETRVGQPFAGLGRIASVTPANVQAIPGSRHGRVVTARFEFVSRAPKPLAA